MQARAHNKQAPRPAPSAAEPGETAETEAPISAPDASPAEAPSPSIKRAKPRRAAAPTPPPVEEEEAEPTPPPKLGLFQRILGIFRKSKPSTE